MSDTPPVLRIRSEDLPPEGAARPPAADETGGRTSGLAWTALGLGILSILFAGIAVGPVAMLLGGVVAWRALGRGGGPSRNALVGASGIVLGAVGTLLWTGLLIYYAGHRSGGKSQPVSGGAPISTGTLDRAAIERAAPPIRRALEASASVVVERQASAGWVTEATGSGTFVGRSGSRLYVLTCAHVIAAAHEHPAERRVRVQWLRGETPDARIEWTGPSWLDLAVLSTAVPEGGDAPAIAPLSFTETVGIGAPVFAIGDPHEYRASYVIGVVSAVRAITEGAEPLRVLQLQLPLNPGNSGGGLYDAAGALIGVNSWRLREDVGEGIGFSIAVDNLRTVAAEAPLLDGILAGSPAATAPPPSDVVPGTPPPDGGR